MINFTLFKRKIWRNCHWGNNLAMLSLDKRHEMTECVYILTCFKKSKNQNKEKFEMS